VELAGRNVHEPGLSNDMDVASGWRLIPHHDQLLAIAREDHLAWLAGQSQHAAGSFGRTVQRELIQRVVGTPKQGGVWCLCRASILTGWCVVGQVRGECYLGQIPGLEAGIDVVHANQDPGKLSRFDGVVHIPHLCSSGGDHQNLTHDVVV
jgi:hypothetical protein